ncbi:protein SMG7-like [Galendromus occidentalis]|uniref:Protein SMG7-like n=1 Tax=Galendromus occidentalis TaxID=34638 RepID=A0AAJ7WJF8_9ACAR|nr:protein SMG7-like [Galendromus occidentalis]
MRVRGANETLKELEKVRTELNAAVDPLDQRTHELRKGFCSLVEDVLFHDLEFAISRKLEQDLWNVGFRSAITTIQKDNSADRSLRLGLMIDMSASYFLQLLQKLVNRYRVSEVKAMPSPDTLGVLDVRENTTLPEEVRITKRSRVLSICQYCLLHLGDLSRYKKDMPVAESYYRRAADFDHRNGHPYNQLGLLEGAKGNRLSTVFFYVRSLSVVQPFVVAISNLEKIYVNIIQDESSPVKDRMNATETISAFLHFIALVHMNQQLDIAAEILPKLMDSLLRLSCSKKIDEKKLLMMTTIGLFTYNRSSKHLATEKGSEESSRLMSEFVVSFFRGALLATLQNSGESGCPTTSTILVLLESLLSNPKSVSTDPCKDLWFVLRTVLNSFNKQLKTEWKNEALPEDIELRGFLPLRHVQSRIDFNENDKRPAELVEELRRSRFVKQGIELCKLKFIDGTNILRFEENEFHAQPVSTTDLSLSLELERLKMGDESRPAVRFSVNDEISKEKPKRQNVALQAIMQQQERFPPTNEGIFSPSPMAFQHSHATVQYGPRWGYNLPVAQPLPPPPPPPPPQSLQPAAGAAALPHPPGPYPLTIEELVKQPPPPIYNVDIRYVTPPPRAPLRPATDPRTSQASAFVRPTGTYSLFSGNSWNPTMSMGPAPLLGPSNQQLMGIGSLTAPNGLAPRPQKGSLWRPEKPTQGTSALERLLKERCEKET